MYKEKNNIIKRTASIMLAMVMAITVYSVVPISAATAADTTKKSAVTKYNSNIRTGAGTGYKKVALLKKGKTITIIGSKKASNGKTWYKLNYKSKTRYIISSNVKIKATDVTYSPVKAAVTKTSLNVRNGAGTKYKKAGTLKSGQSINLKGYKKSGSTKWYKITYNSKTRYVHGSYVRIKSSSTQNTGSSGKGATTTTKKTGITKYNSNIRTGAGTKYKKVTLFKKGKSFTIIGSKKASNGKTWYKLKYKSKTRYIYASNVKIKVTDVNYSPTKKGISTAGLNVRTGPGTGYKKAGFLYNGQTVTLKGYKQPSGSSKWYKITYNSKTRYVHSAYVKIKTSSGGTTTSTGNTGVCTSGFPASYQTLVDKLKAAHPKWVFKPQYTGLNWSDALKYEYEKGNNVYSSGGSWVKASKSMVAYYMDPRNFIKENNVFQFLNHSYNSATQTTDTVRQVAGSTFISSDYYVNLIYTAGRDAGVNPNVLAAMIIQEQGTSGTSALISGTYSKYPGIYNFFNIGAYSTKTMTAVERGLWWAKGAGNNYTSYQRPWNTRDKAIKGGASYYGINYTGKGQNSLYLKKFNVMNGLSKVGTHQYMTHVAGAYGEGNKLARADDYTYTFYIPVYNYMPTTPCAY